MGRLPANGNEQILTDTRGRRMAANGRSGTIAESPNKTLQRLVRIGHPGGVGRQDLGNSWSSALAWFAVIRLDLVY